MGQTLSHGVYLPNEGERNCYAGLASNWQILNTAVGAIAEKAPLVHTHTVSQITDFPAYGNAAGTICEGNDSRLSDARTPVAHTHTKSDVTDLLNSNFIPSANNSYDLGSSSYQWKSVYAWSYYYNGVAWGLDKANTWSGNNTYSKPITVLRNTDTGGFVSLKHSSAELGSIPSSDKSETIFFEDKNDESLGYMGIYYDTSGNNYFRLLVRNKFTSGAPSTSGTVDYTLFSLKLNADRSKEAVFRANIRPYDTTNNYHLGDSTYKWKTLNGINPGALSLPDTLGTSGTENVNYFNVIGYLNNTGTIATIPSTATYDGWLYINAKDGPGSYIIIDDYPASFGTSVFGNNGLGSSSVGLLCLICPIRVGHSYSVRIKSDGIVSARIYPAQGNV